MNLTSEGFVRPRLNEIKADYDRRFTDALGPVNTEPDSVVGQIIGILAAAMDDSYEVVQSVYDSMYPTSAEGVSLDGAVSFVGMERLAAFPTTVEAICYGNEGTLIAAGSFARSLDNKQYITSSDTVISRSSTGDVTIEPSSVLNATNYQIIAGGISVTYLSDGDATADEIVAGLAALLLAEGFVTSALAGALRIQSADLYSSFTLTVDSNLLITKLGTPVLFQGVESGAYTLPENALTVIDSPTVGWNEINNTVAGITGKFIESDTDLRLRHLTGVRAIGAATTSAIRSRMEAEVAGLNYIRVYENRTDTIDAFSLPPHSFEAVVDGGGDQAVADKLFEVKPAGIETYGGTSVSVQDENGDTHLCKFTRPSTKYAWIRVTVDLLYAEEVLSEQVIQSIRDSVIAHGSSLSIGTDIIPQRFFGPIYNATSGLGGITVEASLTALPGDVPVYTTANVAVERAELSEFDELRVDVVGV